MGSVLFTDQMYLCEATIDSVGDYMTVTEVYGYHQPGRNNLDVKGFSVMNQYLMEFPLNVSNFFPNLESIRVFRSELEQISRSDLEKFPQLKEIDLTYNNIQVINSDLFKENIQMRGIALSLNPLKHVAHHIFDDLPYLTILDVRNTRCVNSTTIDSPLNTTEVVFELFRQCPPTTRMLEEEMMASEGIRSILERLDELENNQSS